MKRIQSSLEGGVGRILLDKPARMNALDPEMLAGIERLVNDWENAGASVVVLGSSSARAFCVGADLEVLAGMNETTMREWELLGSRVLDRLQRSPLVSIAAIPGHALGGGLTLAAACDFRVAADTAGFAQPEIGLGWIPGWCGVARLARLIGPGRAKDLCMTGRRVNAAEAVVMGLINEAVPGELLPARVEEFAAGLAASSPAALRAIKGLAASCEVPPAATAPSFDALVNSSLLKDPRAQAAIARFLARKAAKEPR